MEVEEEKPSKTEEKIEEIVEKPRELDIGDNDLDDIINIPIKKK